MEVIDNNISVSLTQSLRKIAHGLDCQSRKCLKETGLTSAQLLLLKAISTMSESTTKGIAKSISLSPATVNVIIDKLVAKGLVERERSLKDRRIVHSHLTTLGHKTLKTAPPLLPMTVMDALQNKNQKEQKALVENLQVLADMFELEPPMVGAL
jgi:DNA-binding MarR family transcriptional regulator